MYYKPGGGDARKALLRIDAAYSKSQDGVSNSDRPGVAMQDRAGEIIDAVVSQALGGDWRRLAELSGQAAAPTLSVLQPYFSGRDLNEVGRDEVVDTLRRTLWTQIRGDEIRSPQIAAQLLNAAWQTNVTEAVQRAQQVTGVATADGILGPQTLAAINRIDPEEFLANYAQPMRGDRTASTAAPLDDAAPSSENIARPGPSFNQSRNKSSDAPQSQTKMDAQANAPAEKIGADAAPRDQFNVEAIAKKSTSDIWTTEDQLGYASYVQAIAKLILDGKAQAPLTVSIQAPWGQGKTSLMRMIERKLEHGIENDKAKGDPSAPAEGVPGMQSKLNDLKTWIKEEKKEAEAAEAMLQVAPGTIPSIWFNPLYFQNSNQVWSGLAHTILKQLVDKLPSQLDKERFWFRLRLARVDTHAIRRDIHKLILERWLPKGLVWFVLLLVIIAQSFTATQIGVYLQQHVWPHLLPFIGALVHFGYQWLNKNKDWSLDDKLAKYIKEPDYNQDMGLLHLVDHDLDRALALLLGEHGRLAVFIDDLDRCTPETVSDILLAINQFISVQHRKLYFILGMDTHMVAMAIEVASEKQAETYNKNRHTSKSYGWRFIEKFVQLPFFIPRIQPEKAREFMDNLLREKPAPKATPAAISDIKQQIANVANLAQLQDAVLKFKGEHQAEALPELDAAVATRLIDLTSAEDSDALNQLVSAAMTDLELNPREMKRFLNVARLLFIRVDHDEDLTSHAHMLKIVRASHLILNWPQCLRWLQGNARSYTVKGIKTDPVESIESLFNKPEIEDFEDWRDAIKEIWGETVAETIAQPDFYTFTKRIHGDPPTLQDIFKARIF